MPLQAPQLDTRTFDELKRLALLRIPRYAPEWTDFNESDPGVTLVELFAWLTEMMLYEVNRVPDRNYIKFLQLLGMELRPAQPAMAYLTFEAQTGALPVPQRAQLSAQPAGGGLPLVFETVEGLDLIPTPLARVQVFDGASFTDVSAVNANPGPTYRPLGWVPQNGSALYLGFTVPNPPPTGRLFPSEMHFGVFLPPAMIAGQPESCRAVTSTPTPPVNLVWEYRQAGTPARWRRLVVFDDQSVAFTREGIVKVAGPDSDATPTAEGNGPDPLYWIRVRLEGAAYPAGQAPTLDFIRPNVAAAENLTTVRGESVGLSQGLPNQTFTLNHAPVWVGVPDPENPPPAPPPGSLTLQVQEQNSDPLVWTAVADFLASGPEDTHYVLNAASGEIRFGDGQNGRIPTAQAAIVALEYRYGGGTGGNVAAGAISAPLTNLIGVNSVKNERPAVGGRDEQTLDDFKSAAPARLRHRNRAVSADDFAALAQETGGIAKATAIPQAHPDFPGVEVPGAVTVVVVPDSDDRPPKPSQAQLNAVCRYLESRRLLTTEMYVRGPEYHPVQVEARVAAQPYASFDAVTKNVIAAINAYLDPLGRQQVPNGIPRGSDFGLALFPTSFYAVILAVEDVKAVRSLSVTVDNRTYDTNQLGEPITVPAYGMFYGVADHIIKVEPYA
jgi:predicted phage baseplate assembly protein